MILSADNLTKTFAVKNNFWQENLTVKAVTDLSFKMEEAQTLALIGESGCGKTTLAKMVNGIEVPDSGTITFQGQEITKFANKRPLSLLKGIQTVFQNPYGALNPRQTVLDIVAEPLLIHTSHNSAARKELVADILAKVGLSADMFRRYPHMFSGGQRQRIAIARAIILKPTLVILDEPTSALDLSVQAQVLNLLQDLKSELRLTYLFISHSISLVKYFADYLMVMYLGRVVEEGLTATVLNNPRHPYTKALINASPTIKSRSQKKIIPLLGEIPSPMYPPEGCPFITRCPIKIEKCQTQFPGKVEYDQQKVYCYRSDYQAEVTTADSTKS